MYAKRPVRTGSELYIGRAEKRKCKDSTEIHLKASDTWRGVGNEMWMTMKLSDYEITYIVCNEI